jgi:hypothetical protein
VKVEARVRGDCRDGRGRVDPHPPAACAGCLWRRRLVGPDERRQGSPEAARNDLAHWRWLSRLLP